MITLGYGPQRCIGVKTYTICPTSKYNRPPPPPVIALHGLDLLYPPIQILHHRFFRRPGITLPEVIDRLKSSLAEALELCPPVAGTVQVNEKGKVVIAVDTKNSLGTPFLVDQKDSPYEGDSEDLAPRSDPILPYLSSAFAAKVTQFSCGTIAVASSLNHHVADVHGFLYFLELWAQLDRGDAIDFTKVPDDWTRTPGRFFPGLVQDSKSGPTMPLPPPPPPFTILPEPATGLASIYMTPVHVSRWRISMSSMERLKRDLSPSGPDTKHKSDLWISSGGDAFAALIFGVITRARHNACVAKIPGMSTPESQTEILTVLANGRESSPQGSMNGRYFGNFAFTWSVTVPRSKLLSMDIDSASQVALSIRQNVSRQISPEAIGYRISFFEDTRNTEPAGRIAPVTDVILSDCSDFDSQSPKLDFGWGKAFTTTFHCSLYPPGYCAILHEKDSGDSFLIIAVEPEAADGLRADSLFNNYATLLHS